MTWLTMTDVVCIDVAVAQATQTLQQLQQQQAALYSGMGAKYTPQYYPYHPDQVGHHQSRAMLGSILASGQPPQQTPRPGQQALERAAWLYCTGL